GTVYSNYGFFQRIAIGQYPINLYGKGYDYGNVGALCGKAYTQCFFYIGHCNCCYHIHTAVLKCFYLKRMIDTGILCLVCFFSRITVISWPKTSTDQYMIYVV